MDTNSNQTLSDIQQFYSGGTVFLTGATGFIGKLLLEKVLRALPVGKVYILMRPKKSDPVFTRLSDIFQSPIFNPIKRTNPELLNKVSVMNGDLSEPILGLSQEDQQKIIDEVDVIFHCAATVRFDEHLKKATTINVKGTRDLIGLAKESKKLKTFMYMGTAFSNSNHTEITETIYQSKITAEDLIKACDSLNDECLDSLTQCLTAGWPNTYTFTKQVVEDYIGREAKNLPICICRPSIVLSTATEPIGAFVDNMFTLAGLAVLGGLGVSRIIYFKNIETQMIPADYVINECIAAGWITGENFLKKQLINEPGPVYNITSGRDNPLCQRYIFDKLNQDIRQVAPKKMVAYPKVFLTNSKYNYLFWRFFFHTLVGHFFDIVRRVQGKQAKFAAAMRKLHTFQDAYTFFVTTSFNMHTGNTAKLLKRMSFTDKELFNFDIKTLDWETYFHHYAKGLRCYLLKDTMDTLPEARQRYDYLKRVMIAVLLFSVVFIYFVGKIVLFKLAPPVFGFIVYSLRNLVC